MPINVFANSSSSYNNDKETDSSLFVEEPYLRTNYIEGNFEEDIDLKNQYRIKNLPDPISVREAASKNYVDNLFNDPGIIKNTKDIDLNDKVISNVTYLEINRLPEFGDQLTSKLYVDNVVRNSIDESSLLRLDPDEKLNLDEHDSVLLYSTLTSSKTIIELPTKNYVDNNFNDPTIKKTLLMLTSMIKISITLDSLK